MKEERGIVMLSPTVFLMTDHAILSKRVEGLGTSMDRMFLKMAGSLDGAIAMKERYYQTGSTGCDHNDWALSGVRLGHEQRCWQDTITLTINGLERTVYACSVALDVLLQKAPSHGVLYERIALDIAELTGERVDTGKHSTGDTMEWVYECVFSWGYGNHLHNRKTTSQFLELIDKGRDAYWIRRHAQVLLFAVGIYTPKEDAALVFRERMANPRWMAELLSAMAYSKTMNETEKRRHFSKLENRLFEHSKTKQTHGTDKPKTLVPPPVFSNEETGKRRNDRAGSAGNVKPRGAGKHRREAGTRAGARSH